MGVGILKRADVKVPVVLLHGWGGSYEAVWKANGWAEALASCGFEPVGIDLPGHGAAMCSHAPADYADLAEDVMAKLPAGSGLLGIGYSLGCKVLLEIEARAPGRFSRLVLGGLGANVFAPEALGGAVATCLERGPQPDTLPVVRLLAEYGVAAGNDPLAIAACLRRPPNPTLSKERLAAVRCPVLLVTGDADSVAYPVDPLAKALPSHQVQVLPGVDHIALPQSLEFQRAAMVFLQQYLLT
ncbi:alpha/beta hydrolase [Pseudomonas sp. CrR25]|nr:alpha/beta hydrolase [Pseudomonas sp. CrR25]